LSLQSNKPAQAAKFSWCSLYLIVLLLSGCGRGTIEQQLAGRWQGQPETAQQRAERSPAAVGEKPANESAEKLAADAEPAVNATRPSSANNGVKDSTSDQPADAAENGTDTTDLEQLDVRVTMQLEPDHSIVMWLNRRNSGSEASSPGQQKQTGTWRVLDALGDRAQLEIVAKREGQESVQRRFELQLLDDGQAMTLREQDADPQFGQLYFKRAK